MNLPGIILKPTTCLLLMAWGLVSGAVNAQSLEGENNQAGTDQPFEIYFDQISARDGLTHNRVTDLLQDKYGYIWAATAHGLNQLDGTHIRNYRMRPDDPASLPANYINRVLESPTGEVWFTFAVGGVSRFNRSERNFTTYTCHRSSKNEQSAVVYDIAWGEEGEVWLATSDGLFRYDPDLDSCLAIQTEPDSLSGGGGKTLRMVFEGSELLITGYQGTWTYSLKDNQLEVVALPDGNGNADGWIRAMWKGGRENTWLSLNGMGVFQWKDGKLHEPHFPNGNVLAANDFTIDPEGKMWFADCSHQLYCIDNDSVTEIPIPGLPVVCQLVFDGKGNLFGFTPQSQILFIEPHTGHWRPVRNVNTKAEISETNSMISAELDNQGNLWFGSFESGLYHQNPERLGFRLYQDLSSKVGSNFVTSIGESNSGKVWISTRGGMGYWNAEMTRFERVATPEFAQLLLVDKKGRLWAATHSGAMILDDEGAVLKTFDAFGQKKGYQHSFMTEDQEGNIWLLNQFGLQMLDPVTGELSVYSISDEHIQNRKMIYSSHSFYQDKKGTYWIGSVRYGLLRLLPRTAEGAAPEITSYLYPDEKNNTLRSQTINYITEDGDGKLWLGCYSSGLLRFDPHTEAFESFPLPDGNVIPNVQGIKEDKSGSLWISSSNGLYLFDPEKETWRQYTEEDGLQSNLFSRGACLKGDNGELYFGGMDGLSVFDPELISRDPRAGEVVLQDISVKGDRLPVDLPYEEVEEIALSYDQNHLEIQFGSVDFLQTGQLSYSYQLEGLDEEWIHTPHSEISFVNLAPGDYTLRLKVGIEGTGAIGPERTLQISIAPPFWKTVWFYAIVALILIGMAYTAHLFRLQAKEAKFREIEDVRKKAAADFHDELGHRLTRISLFAEVVQYKAGEEEEELQGYLEKIKTNSRELYQSMRNFLWALDPEKDAAMELAIILKDFGDEMFDKTGITFNSDDFAPGLSDLSLNMDWKRNLLLIFKEAMHNTLKHSQAQNVHLSVFNEDRKLKIALRDDGEGFNGNNGHGGFGMRNMVERAERVRGTLTVKTNVGMGTSVEFEGLIPSN